MTDPYTPPTSETASASGSAIQPSKDECMWGMLSHLLAILTSFIGPLVVFLVKKDESDFVRDQSAESLNFQITVTLAAIVCAFLTLCLIGIFLLPILAVGALIFEIIACIKASEGKRYRYPLNLRLVR
jgi:uncharacterized Tic20 family protein